jgi:transposase InsO family protein
MNDEREKERGIEINNIEQYLKTKKLPPSIQELHPSNQYKFIARAKEYKLVNGKIINRETGYELVKPEEKENKIISEFKQLPESADKIYERMRGSGLTKHEIEETMKSFVPNQLHRPLPPKRLIKHIVAKEYGEHFEADLVDMSKYGWHNNGIKWMLTVIDIYSRRAWVFKLKNKESRTVMEAIKPLLLSEKVKMLHTDNGSEFTSNEFKEMCSSIGVNQIFGPPYSPYSQGHIERFNRTIKSMLFKYFTYNQSKIWVDVIDKFVDAYNNTKHSVTLEKPITMKAQRQFRPQNVPPIPEEKRFKIGDKVRIALRNYPDYKKKIFEKKYTVQWSKDIYIVVNDKGDMYRVKNEDDNKGDRRWVRWEDLQKINHVVEIPKDQRVGREELLERLHVTKDKMVESTHRAPEETLLQSREKNKRIRRPNVRLKDL